MLEEVRQKLEEKNMENGGAKCLNQNPYLLSLLVPLFINLIFPLSSFAQSEEETMTITTYYPAPYGVYNEMRARRMAVGDNYYDGSQYCWSPDTCANQIDGISSSCWPNCNTDLIVEGNVGIGTTSPTQKLSLKGGNVYLETLSAAADRRGLIVNNTSGLSGAVMSGGEHSTGLGFYTAWDGGVTSASDSAKMVVSNSGNVGIGTTGPASKVHVVVPTFAIGSTWGPEQFVVGTAGSGGSATIGGTFIGYEVTANTGHIGALRPGNAWGNLVLQEGGGNVGIGTASPSARLDVEGTIRSGSAAVGNKGNVIHEPCTTVKVSSSGIDAIAEAPCPGGTRLTGGGGSCVSKIGVLDISRPNGNSWQASCLSGVNSVTTTYAICCIND